MMHEEKALHETGAELEVIPGNLEEGIARRKRKRTLVLATLLGVIGFVIVSLLVVAGGGYYFYFYLPEQADATANKAPWKTMDADNLAFHSAEDFQKAETGLLTAAAKPENKANPLPNFLLGNLYYADGRTDKAIASYESARKQINADWYSKLVYRNYGNEVSEDFAIIYYENNNPEKALAELENIDIPNALHRDYLQAIQDSLGQPNRGDFHLVLGKMLQENMQLKLAKGEIQQAADLSTDPQVRLEASTLLSRMPRHLGDLSPRARYFSIAGQVQENDKNLRLAADFYEQALKEAPAFEWGHNELAIIYREMQDYSRARNYAREAIRLNPEFYHPYLTLGDIALDQSDYTGAINQFSRAQQLLIKSPGAGSISTDANIENQLGFAYEHLNNIQKAAYHYREAMRKSTQASSSADENAPGSSALDTEYQYAQDGLARLNTK